MKPRTILACVLALSLGTAAVARESRAERRQAMREAIDGMALETIGELMRTNPKARELYDSAVGYAVFDNFKVSLLISGGGGVGVAVDRADGRQIYMKSGSGGLGLGLGGQSYQVVFLFESEAAFNRFVHRGFQADASANAVAGNVGKNADASFSDGVAVFPLTHKGLMVQVDISGTRYWKHKKLNAVAPPSAESERASAR